MNNAQIAIEKSEPIPLEDLYGEQEARIMKIVEAMREIVESKAWSTLKEEVFDRLVSSLEKDLKVEARKGNPDTNKLNFINGKLEWAEKYSDLSKLESSFKLELQRIRTRKNEQ